LQSGSHRVKVRLLEQFAIGKDLGDGITGKGWGHDRRRSWDLERNTRYLWNPASQFIRWLRSSMAENRMVSPSGVCEGRARVHLCKSRALARTREAAAATRRC